MAEEIMESSWDSSVSLMQFVLTDDIIGARCLLRDVDDHTREGIVARGSSNEAPLFCSRQSRESEHGEICWSQKVTPTWKNVANM